MERNVALGEEKRNRATLNSQFENMTTMNLDFIFMICSELCGYN